MKRLMALLLTVCLLASPLSAGAADVEKMSTEEVILGVLELLCSGFSNGTLGVTYDDADGYSMAFTLGEDAAGMPGGTLRLPLCEMSEANEAILRASMEEVGLL